MRRNAFKETRLDRTFRIVALAQLEPQVAARSRRIRWAEWVGRGTPFVVRTAQVGDFRREVSVVWVCRQRTLIERQRTTRLVVAFVNRRQFGQGSRMLRIGSEYLMEQLPSLLGSACLAL